MFAGWGTASTQRRTGVALYAFVQASLCLYLPPRPASKGYPLRNSLRLELACV